MLITLNSLQPQREECHRLFFIWARQPPQGSCSFRFTGQILPRQLFKESERQGQRNHQGWLKDEDQPVPVQMRQTSVAVLLHPSKPGADIPFGNQCPPRESYLGTPHFHWQIMGWWNPLCGQACASWGENAIVWRFEGWMLWNLHSAL